MNKQQSPLDNLVQSLTTALTKASNGGGSPKKGKANRPKRQRKGRKAGRANPLSLQVPRNQGLNLTSSQFTATSPLNLFNVTSGSTPGGIRVRGRELIRTVSSPVALTGQFQLATDFGGTNNYGYGQPTTFPRLNAYSTIYEYFVFHKVTYIFQSNQPTTATGEVILAVDYDPNDFVPSTTSEMMRNVSSTMSNVYSDNSCQVLKSLSRLPRYETSIIIGGGDLLQMVQYRLFVGLEGITAAANAALGYIIAEYDVEFFTPQ